LGDVPTILTIGHSSHSWERFASLLRGAAVTAVADVRSAPYSRRMPHFNRDELRLLLRDEGISYRYFGRELGGRPADAACYVNGVADYERMAQSPSFRSGLQSVIEATARHRIALMCSEHDPLDCHRCLLVGRALSETGVNVGHILNTGEVVAQGEIEKKLLAMSNRDNTDFFVPPAEQLAAAYRDRSLKVAYAEPPLNIGSSDSAA
jgi:uncharacterized protein (DUF488 family)